MLCKLYSCTPSELEKQDGYVVESHIAMFNLERKEKKLQGNRKKQQDEINKKTK